MPISGYRISGSNVNKELLPVAISISTLGDNTIFSGVSGKRFVIVHLVLNNYSATTTNHKYISGSTDLSGLIQLAGGAGVVLQGTTESPALFGAAVGEGFVINLSGANTHGGYVVYFLES